MKILNLNIINKDFSNYSIKEWQEYFEKVFNNATLHSVLASTLTQSYLCEVRDEIKKVEITTKEVEKKIVTTWDKDGNEIKIPFKDWEYGYLDIDNLDRVGLERPASWSVPNLPYFVTSYKDITFVDLTGEEKAVDAYSTPEVLQVIDQWIEYLEKFYAEKDK